VWVEGGSFRMGSDSGDSDEKPVHTVSVSGFYIMSTEVTQADYKALIDTNPNVKKSDAFPADGVDWYDAVMYANKLSQKDGLTPAYTISGKNVTWNQSASGWRLPTEAEWEYAAIGGPKAKSTRSADVGKVSWFFDNSGNQKHPVAAKDFSILGLYDMAGNIGEWCWDWKGSYSSGTEKNPTGAHAGTSRVVRGGSFNDDAYLLRSTSRSSKIPDIRDALIGFRLVRRP
jgi:formylglycine-generating enzyme required for sulfatase activity